MKNWQRPRRQTAPGAQLEALAKEVSAQPRAVIERMKVLPGN
jgi:hypothetical protein